MCIFNMARLRTAIQGFALVALSVWGCGAGQGASPTGSGGAGPVTGGGAGAGSPATLGDGGPELAGTGGTTGAVDSGSNGNAIDGGSGGSRSTGGSGIGGNVGTTGTGGTGTGGGAVSGTGGGVVVIPEGPCDLTNIGFIGSAVRPQLTDVSAPCFTPRRYLAATDSWDPTAGLPVASAVVPKFTVAADGTGSHTTVQAAIDATFAAGGTSRTYILVKPGTYREPVCVMRGTPPITLYGADTDATKVTIAFDNIAQKVAIAGSINRCTSVTAGSLYGTTGSTTFFIAANDFQAMNLTIANDTNEAVAGLALQPAVAATGTLQAVAMTTTGDKLVFQNVRVIGNQDTLQPASSSATTAARSYYRSSTIEGDTDFIFGSGVAVFDNCAITYTGLRKNGGSHVAPSTDGSLPYGFLIVNSHIVAGPGATAGRDTLGRAYDPSNQPTANGQAVIRDTVIDAHVNVTTPWGASTQSRAFNAATNRLYEYKNTGPGAAS